MQGSAFSIVKRIGSGAAIALAAAGGAWADTIDLTSPSLGSIYGGAGSFSVLSASGVTVTFSALPPGATFTYNVGSGGNDGLGIQHSYEFDEIERPESLRISFSAPVLLEGFVLTDLFRESRNGNWYNERGTYSINDGPEVQFTAPNSNLPFPTTNGVLAVDVNALFVGSAVLTAPGIVNMGSYSQDHDFSVAQVSFAVSPIPEPQAYAMLLAGLGLLGFEARRRRREKACMP